MRPFTLTTAPRLALSRTEIIGQLYDEHGFQEGGLTLTNMMSFLTHGALRHTSGEVRDKAERLIVSLYEKAGSPVREYLLNCDEKTRKSLLYKQLFKAFERIDNAHSSLGQSDNQDGAVNDKPTRVVSDRQDGAVNDKQNRVMRDKPTRVVSDKPDKVVSDKRAGASNNRHRAEVTDKNQNQTKNKIKNTSELQGKIPPASNDNERMCIFCGEVNESFTDEGLDIHYWKSCPVLQRCQYCRQVVEISGLTDHLLQECESHTEFKQCPRCAEVLHSKHYAQHVHENSCTPAEPGKSRCPLCHENIDSTEESWRTHLMSTDPSYGCQNNPRLKQQLQQHTRAKPDPSLSVKSTKSPKTKLSPSTTKVKVK